jgi:hypothetical protein
MQGIDIPGINWETGVKGTMMVDLDGNQTEHDFIRVPLPKASIKDEAIFAVVDIDKLPEQVFTEVILQGLKALVNRGPMTKITGQKTDKSRQDAVEAAQSNIDALYAGKIRFTQGQKTAIPRAIRTLALNKARFLVREALKNAGERPNLYKQRLITEAAEGVLGSAVGLELIEEARAEVAAREEKAKAIDISFLKPDPELVAKEKEKVAKRKAEPKFTAADIAKAVTTTRRPELRR